MLAAEALQLLAPRPDGLYVDCTVGLGGHTEALLTAGAGRVIGIDRDPQALDAARTRLAEMGERLELVHADYRDLDAVLAARGGARVTGILADLGVSSMQLDDPARGFSFRADGPLDMRMDPTTGPTAADLLNTAGEAEIADAIFHFGEERHARRIARAIVAARVHAPFARTNTLASIARRAAGGGRWQRLDPATRTFQALRIWVNRELDGLDAFVRAAVGALERGGRLVVIAFHSLEDRVVKHTLRALAETGAVELLTRKPIRPGDAEIERNPRSRSARLRAVEKIA